MLTRGQELVTSCIALQVTWGPIFRTSSLCHGRQLGKQRARACTQPSALTLQYPPLWRRSGMCERASTGLLCRVPRPRGQMMLASPKSEMCLGVLHSHRSTERSNTAEILCDRDGRSRMRLKGQVNINKADPRRGKWRLVSRSFLGN